MGKGGYGCRMSTNRGGVVLNISSIQGLLPWPAMPTYSAAKSGMITYTRCAGHQLEYQQHGVRMICLCPGAVDTAMQVN
jgi:NAD(P)-dependent dehydrogenase (short-subunit alcohol dehydrogenase family)